ncbi:uncharacterized protein DUF4038 [Mucilaginibacter gracilis]|uniref:DUF5060 domain-containing protein n=3 Tax=Mucilaginibacter TaxID=423349 RepID=H1YHQ6_9SPHI|nr:DUF5060 domain-containing protein [Mucilaginibacter gracilis]EHQ27456.1 hypothetical protein Mucpa_3356 [Mucilaginibacter paludis DSM 18603]RKR81023.1 uncharacterized protein DUF4038 [Mucilaginibacter gracilis]
MQTNKTFFLFFVFVVLLVFLFLFGAHAQVKVERWNRFEISLKGPVTGNPFTENHFSAIFSNNSKRVSVDGFYDGEGNYLIRFMPMELGKWNYITVSNIAALNHRSGLFTCVAPNNANHGMIRVADTYHFRYEDGKPYYPFGTTAYAWIHQGPELEEATLTTLKSSAFNKIRMCILPKYYTYVTNEPLFYPYEKGDGKNRWNFKRFNPAFFRHLEKRIDDLNALGIEADLIIFHPYDKGHWGFDSMGKENDLLYIKYLAARLSAFRNVWWSMANEFDYIKSKPRAVWDDYAAAVVGHDPYRHLCSIHNGSVYYDNWKPYFTHVSIQNGAPVEDFGRAGLLRDVYFKPVIYDEVCYEGNLPQRWGRLTGQEMTAAVWQGIIAGTYVTHGESIKGNGDTIFWAKGGILKGESPARIAFLRTLLENGPGPLHLADNWKDNQTAQTDSTYYLIYLGKPKQKEWMFSLPKKGGPPVGTKYKVDLIDTWKMSVTPINQVFETSKADGYRIYDKNHSLVSLPDDSYLAFRIHLIK